MPRAETRVRRYVPVFISLMAVTAAAMVLPATVGLIEGDEKTARAFTYGAALLAVLTAMLAIVSRRDRPEQGPRAQLLTLLGAYTLLPLLAAIPFHEAIGQGTLWAAWFEMISDFTTTGATAYERLSELPRAAHLWRAMVGWGGGFFIWVSAVALLAPLNLGGYEVRNPITTSQQATYFAQMMRFTGAEDRMLRYVSQLFPIYAGLTFVVFVSLLIAREDELVALTHAMAVLSTSAISPVNGLSGDRSGMAGEIIILLFFVFALSRVTFARDNVRGANPGVKRDPELMLGLAIGLGVALLLFLRHWVEAGSELASGGWTGLKALWGAIFTSFSFLTTTGFISDQWGLSTGWSGLSSPGLALVGLALIGGGVATTAGGVKLLRVYALGQHMRRELQLQVLPSSVGGPSQGDRRTRKQGAIMAWVLFMLFALSNAVVMILLSIFGVPMEDAMVFSVAALANCGPLAIYGGEAQLSYAALPPGAQGVLAAAMVAGRLEALAIIALLNREIWRR